MDAAPSFPHPDVASALVRTYLTIDDAGIQQSVERALRAFPPLVALEGILRNIVDLDASTESAPTVVDVFPDDLDTPVLDQMAAAIDASSREQIAAYTKALKRALRDGSEHAEALLEALDG
ncbi:MAG: hypothetical protein R3F14_17165 [Polyangiaceae bacterium]